MLPNWENFCFNEADPWLGTSAKFGFVDISFDNNRLFGQGFYWLYPCKKGLANPTILRFAGGPGMSVLHFAFNDKTCPLLIDIENLCFKKNSESLTDNFNLLYIESPLGSGCSTVNSILKNEVGEHLETDIMLMQEILKIYPEMKEHKFFYRGESYGIISAQLAAIGFYKKLGIPQGGLVLESAYFDRDLLTLGTIDTLIDHDIFKDMNYTPEQQENWCKQFHMRNDSLQSGSQDFRAETKNAFEYWINFIIERLLKITIDPDTNEPVFSRSFMNLSQKNIKLSDIFAKYQPVQGQVSSKKFAKLLGLQK